MSRLDDEEVVGPEPGIDGHQVAQRAHEEERAHDQHQRERHLRDDEEPPQAEALAGGGDAAAARLHGRAGGDVGGAQRRARARRAGR